MGKCVPPHHMYGLTDLTYDTPAPLCAQQTDVGSTFELLLLHTQLFQVPHFTVQAHVNAAAQPHTRTNILVNQQLSTPN
jgi:hypothetical protein